MREKAVGKVNPKQTTETTDGRNSNWDTNKFIVFYDRDKAGREHQAKALSLLAEAGFGERFKPGANPTNQALNPAMGSSP